MSAEDTYVQFRIRPQNESCYKKICKYFCSWWQTEDVNDTWIDI